jgi:hypothetical protein
MAQIMKKKLASDGEAQATAAAATTATAAAAATGPAISEETTATEEKEGYTSYGAIEDPEAAAAVTQSVIENAIFTQHFKYALPFLFVAVSPQKIVFNHLLETQLTEEIDNFNELTSVSTILRHHEVYTLSETTIDSTRYETLIPDSSISLNVQTVDVAGAAEASAWSEIEVLIDYAEQNALNNKFGFSFSNSVERILEDIIADNSSLVEPPTDSKISYVFNKVKNDKLTDQNTQVLTDLSPIISIDVTQPIALPAALTLAEAAAKATVTPRLTEEERQTYRSERQAQRKEIQQRASEEPHRAEEEEMDAETALRQVLAPHEMTEGY